EFRATRAWKALSFGSRCLYVELKGFYSFKQQNNVFLSVLEAMKVLGKKTNHCKYYFAELEHYGFIVKMTEGCLGSDGIGVAPHYRLTELCNVNLPGPATRDYLNWDGVPYQPPWAAKKTESHVENPHGPCRNSTYTGTEKKPVLDGEPCRKSTYNNGGD